MEVQEPYDSSMHDDLTNRVKFNFLRYANCWEDVDILLQGLAPAQGSKILSIGSAGDNSFSLLTTHPELVVAVDVNKVQLHLIELKKMCIKHLSRQEVLCFLGFHESATREASFEQIRKHLSPECQQYWKANLHLIKNGVIHEGKFEKYFQIFSKKVLPWIHTQSDVEALLSKKTENEQRDFHDNQWNTWRWKLLFRIFFSRYLMGKLGRDPAFLNEVQGSVSEFIYRQAQLQLKSVAAQENHILRYNLSGSFGNLLPHYLQESNYDIIKSNIDKLQMHEGFAQHAVVKFGKFDFMNLSDIFEYLDSAQFKSSAEALLNGMNKRGKIAYWNLMVPRKISDILPKRLQYLAISKALTAQDKGFFYKEFIVEQVL